MKRRILSWVLALAMILSMVPGFAFAEGEGTAWTKTAFETIQPTDTVAITMTKDGVTYALPTTGAGGSGQPLGDAATVSGTTLTTRGDSAAYGWSIVPTEGGFHLKTGESYLYITATNNGVRIGETGSVFTLIPDNYLSADDGGGTVRYLGVYAGATPDWRCYKAYATGNISGEILEFWVLDPNADPSDPPETTIPTEPDPTETTQPSETDPTEPPAPVEGEVADLVTELENGAVVYVYNPTNKAVLTATVSGTQLAAATGTVENDQLAVTEEMEALTVEIDADGYYSFLNEAGEYLTCGASANNLTFEAAASEGSLWTVEAGEGGFFVKSVPNPNMALEYYKGNYTVYSFQSYNPKAYLMQFFAGTAGGFTDTIATGDNVIIYNPTYSMALGTAIVDTAKNQDLAGTELVLNHDGKLSGYTDENVWTVTANEDGTYSFTSMDGQKLAVVNRTHLGFAEEATNWTLQLIEGKSDEFFVGSGQGTFLEWYADKNYWSAYYNPSEAMYAIRFYLVGGTVQPSNVVATPKASVKSGTVTAGTVVELTCATEGATILYKVGNGEWQTYTEALTITEDTTITVKAVMEGQEDSKEVTFTYTIYVPPTLGDKQAQLVTDASQLASGDRIIIVTKDLDYSLGITQKANNRDYGIVVKAMDRCSYDEGTQIITLESGVEDGTFALYATNGDFPGYLYASPESGNLLRTQDAKDLNASWTITVSANGEAAITSKLDKKANTIRYNTVGIFSCYGATGQKPVSIYKLDGQDRPGLPEENDVVVIYTQSAKGVLSGMDGDLGDIYGCSVKMAPATIENGKAICSNGALLFKVEKNGEYYRFFNESFGYLCSTGTGNNTFYTMEASEDADWTVEEYNGGYRMGSRTAKHEENVQYLQFFSDHFTTWGMYAVTDRDVFTYHFYPCGNEKITDGVVNEPCAVFGNPAPAYAGRNYVLHFTVDAIFGVKEIKAFLGETELDCKLANERYGATIPAEYIVGDSLTVTVKGLDNKGVEILSEITIEVKDEPVIGEVTPIANAQTKENKRPEITAKLTNVGENPVLTMTVNGEAVEATYADGILSYTPAEDMAEGRVTVTVTVTRADGKTASKTWSFTIGESSYILMFGQLHSHNGEYSDGAGTLAGALEYIGDLPEDANVDFVAFTDHSNYFDSTDAANPEAALFNKDLCTDASWKMWNTYKTAMAEFNATHDNIIAIPGFEMTWSGGPGHMNTFVTEGIVSRNNKTLNNKSSDAGMRAYYDLLSTDEGVDSITQLNHPGTTFGNFTDFAYWNEAVDTRVHLVEVGNGEGPVHGSGYYPSYEQYILALDKGWHIAPTNNQDNHKGKWGNGNEARDVVLAEEFSEEAIYEAIRNYRVYATEDRNLEIGYSVNDLPMGTIIETVPQTLKFDISLMDPDEADSTVRVELVVNSGKVAYTWDNAEELAKGILAVELEPEYSYYFLRVTQADKDIAVTAPIWVGESLKVGLRETTADILAPVVGEEVTISTTLYNEEASDAVIKSVVYTLNGSQVLFADTTSRVLSAVSTETLEWKYIPEEAKISTITVTVVLEYEGKDYTYTASVELDVTSADELTYLAIDASHSNEYVNGYNKDLLNSFLTMAGEAGIRVELLTSSEALIAACEGEKFAAILLNPPSRRLSEAKDYSEAELEALKQFHSKGGNLILTGLGDSNDKMEPHIAATQNRLLAALESALRLSDDGTYEDSTFGLTFDTFGTNDFTKDLTTGVSFYGGSSIYVADGEGNAVTQIPETVYPILFANANTISKDGDSDGKGGDIPVYGDGRLMVMAAERQAGKGLIFVAGAPFMNDYDLKIPAENGNNDLVTMIFAAIRTVKVTDIAEVRKVTEEGYKFTIEGVVTSNASGYDKETAFFDCIYVQDETAGINCFPVAGEYRIGDVLRITGTTDFYQGEPELQVMTIEKLGEADPVEAKEITADQLNDRSVEGSLVTIAGVATEIVMANGLVESIYVKDAAGDIARVFIDGYITGTKTIENLEVGAIVTATGIASYDDTYAISHNSYARIRVRDRADIVATACEHTWDAGKVTTEPTCAAEGVKTFTCTVCGATKTEAVAPTGEHTYDEGVVTVEPTCATEGVKTFTCTVCGATKTEAVPATGEHTYENGTCTDCGEKDPMFEEPFVNPFDDVAEEAWYYEYVMEAAKNGLVNGMKENLFMPEKNLTRAQFAVILYRSLGEPSVEGLENPYIDLEAEWYKDAVIYMSSIGVINGVGKGKFAPENNITREQMVTMLYRLSKDEISDEDLKVLDTYADQESVSEYARVPMAWAIKNGIVNGVGKNKLNPQGLATRAQAAKVVYLFAELIKTEE